MKSAKNNSLGLILKSALDFTDKQQLELNVECYFEPYFYLLGGNEIPISKAEEILDKAFEHQQKDGKIQLKVNGELTCFNTPPLYAGIIWQFVQKIEDKKEARKFIKKYFDKLILLHEYWYQTRDIFEDGLVTIIHPIESLLINSTAWDESLTEWSKRSNLKEGDLKNLLFHKQEEIVKAGDNPTKEWGFKDPVINTILCWSNEGLIAMGKMIRKNVSEVIQWNELACYTMNEQLWDEEYAIYRGMDIITKSLPLTGSIGGLLPLLANIPVQEQAEAMHGALRLNFEKDNHYLLATNSLYSEGTQIEEPGRGAMSILFNWFLFQGLSRFDLIAFAEQIKKDTLAMVSEYGYYLHYVPIQENLKNCGIGKGNNPYAAALLIHFTNADASFYQETSEDPD